MNGLIVTNDAPFWSQTSFLWEFCLQSHQRSSEMDAQTGHVIYGPESNWKPDNLTNCIMHYILVMSGVSFIRRLALGVMRSITRATQRDGPAPSSAVEQHNVSTSPCPFLTWPPLYLKQAVMYCTIHLFVLEPPRKCPNSSSAGEKTGPLHNKP